MAKPPRHDFGKRGQPAALPLPDMPQAKRSNHVALLVMGTLAVGGGAYALMPRQSCQPQPAPSAMAPPSPGMAQGVQGAVAPQAAVACPPRGSSSSGGGGSGSSGYSRTHLSFFGGGSSYGSSASPAAAAPSSSGVTRGGFGSFGHAFGGFSSGS